MFPAFAAVSAFGASRRFIVSKIRKSAGSGNRISCNLPTLIEKLLDKA